MFARLLLAELVAAALTLANTNALERIVLTARLVYLKNCDGVKFVRRLQPERLTLFPPGNRELKGVFAMIEVSSYASSARRPTGAATTGSLHLVFAQG